MKFIQCRACFSGQPERPAVKWHFMKHLFASIISAGKWDNIYHIIVSICWKKTCRAFALVYYYYYYYYLGFFFIRHIFPEIICQVLQRSSRKRTLWNCWCILYYSPDVCHLSCHLANSVKEVCKKNLEMSRLGNLFVWVQHEESTWHYSFLFNLRWCLNVVLQIMGVELRGTGPQDLKWGGH